MRVFGNQIGIVVASSSSFATGSSNLNEPIPALSFLYAAPNNDYRVTGSIASIEAILTNVNNSTGSEGGAAGALSFKISDPNSLNTTGSEVMRMFITSSEPRVGIGFKKDESIKKAFEIKTQKDNAEGTEIVLEGSRTTTGAQIGDEAGRINFVISSGSFNDKFSSGSIANIKTKVKSVNETGVSGRLVMGVSKDTNAEPIELWTMGYGDGTTGGVLPNFLGMVNVFTGSLQLTDLSSGQESSFSLTDSDATITYAVQNRNNTQGKADLYLTGNITGSDITIDDWGSVSSSLAEISASAAEGGAPGGSNAQVQYNNNGNFGGNSNFTWNDSTNTLSVLSSSLDYVLVNDRLQGNGSGFQFFAFNEDTTKVKFANWFTGTDNQYGMGMLWYETWFAAIDTDGNANDVNRRIGFYLEQPEAGATDSTSGETGRHPNNARFYVDITGSYVASGGLHVTDADFNVESNGNVEINGTLDMNNNDIDNVNNFTINNTLTATTVTGSLLRLSENGSGLRLTNVGGFEPQSGVFNIFGNNDVTFGAGGSGASERVLTLVESNRHAQFEAAVSASVFSGSFVGDGSNITNIAVAASDITGLIDISSQTNLAAGNGIDLTGDTISADVTSVAGQTGAVTLTADDISDTGTTNKFTTQANLTKLSNLNISGAGDFVNNEFIVAVGTNAVTSSDALAVDSAGNLGIGTSTPEVRLHMVGEGSQTSQILMEQYNDNQDAPDIRTRRYRGTEASPSDVQTGDYLFRLNVHGQDGGSSALYGSMRFDVDGTDQDALEWGLQTRDTNGTVADRITIDSAGDTIIAGEVSSNTIKNIETTLASDSATNIDTFATATYKGAIYDYVLYDAGVGARTGQFMVIQDNSNIEFTDISTPTLGTETSIPSITADIDGSNVRVRVTNGNGYTFKAFVKKL